MIDKLLGAGLFISIIIRDILGYNDFDQGILIFGPLLGLIYLVAYWWINKPKETTIRTLIVTSLYGLTFSSLTFTIVFKVLFLSGSDQMTMLSLILIVATLTIDFVTSLESYRLLNRKTLSRLLIFIPTIGLLFLINQDTRIKFTHRKNSDFLEFYNQNKDFYPTFYDLKKDYQNSGRE